MKKRLVVLFLALTLVIGAAVGGTIAWLMDTSETVVNTFTVGKVDISLKETENGVDTLTRNYKMVPGNTMGKDPAVTVTGGSEDCWLFVEITEMNDLDQFIEYEVADGWTALEGEDGVFYRTVTGSASDQVFPVLKNNQVTVKNSVTSEMMEALTENTLPKLSFTAYAIQKANIDDVATAWSSLNT